MSAYVVGIGAVVAMSVGWLFVQRRWSGAFADVTPHSDALAARGSCHDCALPVDCERKHCHIERNSS